MSESKGSGFLGGVILGGLLGVAVGLLIAPRPGEETREIVGVRIKDTLSRVDQAFQEQRDAIEIAIAAGKETALETEKQVSEALNEAISKVENPE